MKQQDGGLKKQHCDTLVCKPIPCGRTYTQRTRSLTYD
jgi:hypothetical protein